MAAYPRSYDPGLAPAPKGSLSSGLRLILGLHGSMDPGLRATPQKKLQAETTAEAEAYYSPLVTKIKDTIAARAKSGSDTIGAYTGQWMDRLQGAQAASEKPYDEAISGAGQDAAALAGFFQRHGDAAYQGLAEKIGQAGHGAEQLAVAADHTQGAAKSAAGTTLAHNNAFLGRLRSDRAAASASAAELPGIAALGGQRSLRLLQGQLNTQQAEQLAEIESKMPGLIAQILQGKLEREDRKLAGRMDYRSERAQLGAGYVDSFENRELQKAVGRQGFATEGAEFQQRSDQFEREMDEVERHNKEQERLDDLRAQAADGGDRVSLQTTAEAILRDMVGGFVTERPVEGYMYDPDGPARDTNKDGKPDVGTKPSRFVTKAPAKRQKGDTLRFTKDVIDPITGKRRTVEAKPKWKDAFSRAMSGVGGILRSSGLFTEQEIRQIVTQQLLAAGYKQG